MKFADFLWIPLAFVFSFAFMLLVFNMFSLLNISELDVDIAYNASLDINGSSGTVIYNNPDTQEFYVLGAYHSVSNQHAKDQPISLSIRSGDRNKRRAYTAKIVKTDIDKDLALMVVVDRSYKYKSPVIADTDPVVGTFLFSISNPSGIFRTVDYGILSNTTGITGPEQWMVNINILPGSSGGGVYNTKGELVAIIQSVATYVNQECEQITKSTGACSMPLLGFTNVITRPDIADFLLDSEIGRHFKYLE